ncbi:rhodanese-like domain-containing protein [Cyclobacteriaceae bacterium]|nr:rhodanese-like domain-containing protein [Cyclobacteriaceae bacterium]
MKTLFTIVTLALVSFIAMQFVHIDEDKARSNFSKNNQDERYTLSVDAFDEQLQKSDVILIDVRTSGELVSGKIQGAINYNLYHTTFVDKIKRLDKSNTILLYCASGSRSNEALHVFLANGFDKVYQLNGGIRKWKHSGRPLTDRLDASKAE